MSPKDEEVTDASVLESRGKTTLRFMALVKTS